MAAEGREVGARREVAVRVGPGLRLPADAAHAGRRRHGGGVHRGGRVAGAEGLGGRGGGRLRREPRRRHGHAGAGRARRRGRRPSRPRRVGVRGEPGRAGGGGRAPWNASPARAQPPARPPRKRATALSPITRSTRSSVSPDRRTFAISTTGWWKGASEPYSTRSAPTRRDGLGDLGVHGHARGLEPDVLAALGHVDGAVDVDDVAVSHVAQDHLGSGKRTAASSMDHGRVKIGWPQWIRSGTSRAMAAS